MNNQIFTKIYRVCSKQILLIAVPVLIFTGILNSNAQPVADFSFSPVGSICANDTVFFTNLSTGAVSYFWDFGDFAPNDTSTSVNPSYVYTWDWTYTVTLTAYDSLGDSAVTTQPVTIKFTPWLGWAWFWSDPNLACPLTSIQFNSFLFPTPTYTKWYFGDGDSSSIFTPTHSYTDTGTYLVTFIAGNVCGADTTISPVTIDSTVAPSAFFWMSFDTVCRNSIVEFSNSSWPTPVSNLWYFGDGDSSTAENPSHSYADTGVYAVTLIAFSDCSSDTVSDTIVVDTTIIPNNTIWAWPNTVCPGDIVNFTGNGNDLISFLWDFDDGDNSLQQNPTHAFSSSATYNVKFTATNTCGLSNTDSVSIVVDNTLPPSAFWFWWNPNPACPGSSVQFTYWSVNPQPTNVFWDFDDGDTTSEENPSHVFASPGTYNVKLIATNNCGNKDTVTNVVTINSTAVPWANFWYFPFFTPICPGSPVTFQNGSSDTTNSFWDFGDSTTSTEANPVHVFSDTGSYNVLLTITNACGNSASWTETVNITNNAGPPNADFWAFPNSVCPGEIVNFNVPWWQFDTSNVVWYFGDGDTATIAQPSHLYSAPGTYTVTFIVITACGNDTVIKQINVNPGSMPDFTYTLGCAGDTIFFTDASTPTPDIWAWDFGDGDTSTVQNPIHVFASTGTYNVSLTVSASGCTGTITKLIGMNIITSSVDANCGLANGEASVTVTGGIPPYAFLWNDSSSQTTAIATAITAGTYMVIVTDSAGCVDSAYAVINNNAGGSVFMSSITQPNCGVCDGAITASVTGGSPPFTYLWNDPLFQTTPTATGLCPGTYTITITDSLGCIDSANLTITEPIISLTTSTFDAGCGANGWASVTTSGGTSPYTYLWNDPGLQTNDTAFGLDTGNYTVIVNDNGGCVDSASVTIFLGSGIILTTSTLDASCTPNGQASVVVFGGIPPYTYLWNDPGSQINDTATGLAAGNYIVIVNDDGGCTDSASVTIFASSGLTFTVFPTDLSSCGTTDGSIAITPTSGTPPYTYVWNTGDSTAIITGLDVGVYIITVIDSNGCSAKDAIGISEPSGPLDASFSSSSDQCFSGNSFTFTRISGFTMGSFTWDFGDGVQTSTATDPPPITYSAPGEYIVTMEVIDMGGTCFAYDADIINVFEEPLPSVTGTTSCGGGCDGEATVTTTGGIPPYAYLWNDPLFQTDSIADSLCSGSYDVIVTDTNNCTDTASIIISISTLALSVDSTNNISCNGAADGLIYTSISGGILPLEFKLDTIGAVFQLDSVFSGLTTGSYDVIVRDAILCTDTVFGQTISEPSVLSLTPGSIDASCGNADGSAFVTVIGSVPPYTYLWNDSAAQTTDTAAAIYAGIYTVIVTDSVGCIDSTIAIVNNTVPSVLISDSVDVSCNGDSDGTATISTSGGITPYTFSWSPSGETDSNAVNLSAGVNTVTVTDSAGCIASVSVTINEPTALSASTDSFAVICNGSCDGIAIVSVSGGTPPYSYSWDDPGVQITDTATGLCADTFTVVFTDSLSCIDSASVIIAEPPLLTSVITDSTDNDCNGNCNGTATDSASGGTPPYSFAWDDPFAQSTPIADSLCAGTFNVIVTDINGCTDTSTVTINEPALILSVSISGFNDVICNSACDGYATAIATGGTVPYTFLWDDPFAQTDTIADSLCAGTFLVTVTDSNGCTASDSVIISEPTVLSLTPGSIDATCGNPNGVAYVSVTGGVPSYTYLWDDSATQTTDTATGLYAGSYSVIVTDTNGCTDSVIATVNDAGPPSVIISSITGVSCNGGSDGTMAASATVGTPPYSFSWLPAGGTDSVATGLIPGIYTVTVTDSLGCIANASDTVFEPPALTITMSSNDVQCNGTCDGDATASPSGGTPPYSFSWDDPFSQTTPTADSLCTDTFTVIITDSLGCVNSTFVTIAQPPSLTSGIASFVNVDCNGDCNGTATATASGGILPYTFLWDDPFTQNTITADSLCAGSYFVTVTDSNSCTSISGVLITQPTPLIATIISSTDVTCNGDCNGFVTVSASGGSPSYTYAWDDTLLQTTITALSLCAGTYNVVVTDIKGCTDTSGVTINEPTALTPAISDTTDASCGGTCDGIATVTPSGGIAPYTYAWDDPLFQTDSTAIGLCAGPYGVIVTDSNNCKDTVFVTISEPPALVLSMNSNDAACGIANGEAIVLVSGGFSSYTYLWDDSSGQTSDTATGLTAGIYTVTITDSSGCIDSASISVNNTGGATVTIISTVDVNCNGGNGGEATASAAGGTPPYSFSWSPGGDTNITATGLSAGVHTVTLTDSNGCISSVIDTIFEPPTLLLSTSVVDANCGQSDGEASVSVTGGTPGYSYQWDDPGFQTTATATGLFAGTYIVQITDSNGCIEVDTAIVSDNPGGAASVSSSSNVLCNSTCDGNATASITGGTSPFTYQWDDPAAQTSVTAAGLCADTFSVIITDALSCKDTASIIITEPAVLSSSATSNADASCNGSCDGEAIVSASGGSGGYTYQWDDAGAQTNDTAIGLCAGTYTAIVTDVNGCADTSVVIITEPPAITLSTNSIDAACGIADGQAFVSASNGVPPYTWLWDDSLLQTTDTATGLSSGVYSVLVTDSNSCTASASVAVNDGGSASISVVSTTDVTCNGDNDGSATISASGGTPPYSYQWDDPGNQTTAIATNLIAGTYTAAVTDSNSCIATAIVTINEPPALAISITGMDISCNGSCDGEATPSVTGGIAPYSYLWDDPLTQTTNNATGLCSNTFTVIVTDSNGCNDTAGVVISEPPLLTSGISGVTNASCGICDGDATVSAAGGTTPYTYSWNDPGNQITAIAINLCAGSYNVVVTDSNACTVSSSINITGPAGLSSSIDSSINVICNGNCDGYASVSVAGGISPYSYSWNDPLSQTSIAADSLCAGNYSVIVTDNAGCFTIASVVISEPPAIIISIVSTNVFCNGACDGSADMTVTGGTSPFTFSWSNGCGFLPCTNLCAGSYTVTVTDFNGCTDTANVQITQPAAIVLTTTINNNVSCFGGSDGSATVDITGGNPPYTYLWDNGEIDSTAIALNAGMHIVTVTDLGGCVSVDSIVISEPPVITTSVVGSGVSCNGGSDGSADLTVSGGVGPPYTFSWIGGACPIDDPTVEDPTGLGACVYTIVISDTNGCNGVSAVVINEPDTLIAAITSSADVTCNSGSDGSATVSVPGVGTPPYTYLWSPSGGTGATATGLVADTFTVLVTDSNGCDTTAQIIVTEPSALTITGIIDTATQGINDGGVDITVSGGTVPYSYNWSNSDTTEDITLVAGGSYTVIVTDSNGCMDSANFIVPEITGITVTIPDIKFEVYPNPTTGLITFDIILPEQGDICIEIYNFLGIKLFMESLGSIQYIKKDVDLSEFSAGLYFVRLINKDKIINKRITLNK